MNPEGYAKYKKLEAENKRLKDENKRLKRIESAAVILWNATNGHASLVPTMHQSWISLGRALGDGNV